MTAPDAHTSDRPDDELGAGWLTVTAVIGVLAALVAAAGMVLSFHAVSVRMTPSFGPRWAWLVPLVVDLTVLVFSGVDLVLARRGIPHPLARWTVYGATFGTVWLNYAAGGDLTGRIAHVLMPSVWVMFVELMRHVVRHEANLVGVSLRQPIPAARWLLSPWPTLKLWRRMILWQEHSYPRALAHERERLRKAANLRHEHGRLWRWRVTPLVRLELNLGPDRTNRTDASGSADTTVQRFAEPETRTEPANPNLIPEPATNPAAERPEPRPVKPARTAAANPRPNNTAQADELRAKRLQIIREMAAANHGGVSLAAIQARFNCAKSTASEMRRDALKPAPGSAAEVHGEDEPEPARAGAAA